MDAVMKTIIDNQITKVCCEHLSGSTYPTAPIQVGTHASLLSASAFLRVGGGVNSDADGRLNISTPERGSRRARLWELPTSVHCSVIGVCFPINALRRLVAKHYGEPCTVSDYELHSAVVRACSVREPLIDLVQRDLDKRYQMTIKRFQSAITDDAVVTLWQTAASTEKGTGDLAGALWASLTHPRANDALRTYIGHEIHMIQHQLGGDVRRDVKVINEIKKISAQRAAELDIAR